MTVAVLGILKSGAAYVPLDPAYPLERLAVLSRKAGLAALVTREALKPSLPALDAPVVCLDDDTALAEQPEVTPAVPVPDDSPAYVIFTSGSTGEPKGVVVSHRSVVNHNVAVADIFGLTPSDRVLQFHSISFDAAVEELFPTWWAGATLVLRGADLVAPGDELHRLIAEERLTVLNLPTAYWHEWVSELARTGAAPPAPLRLVIAGGERASGERYRAWREGTGSRVRWLNTYGPTETTVISTWDEPDDGGGGEMAIGRPLANTRTYVLDRQLRPVPVGVAGELYVGGEGVARGYLDRPDLTAERFVPDPFDAAPGARLYRTGDRARYRADGRLECLGRLDEQVKIRGFRIEPAEIEAALRQHPLVSQAAVLARKASDTETRLVAYIVPHAEAAGAEPLRPDLARFLQERLPAYMTPSAIVVLDALPMTPSGKVDRKALPDPETSGASRAAAPPATATEELLAGLWSQVLGIGDVGVDDDFFALGGHSLKASELAYRIREAFAIALPLRSVFEAPTVRALARRVDEGVRGGAGAPPARITPAERTGPLPLSYAQEGAWWIDRLQPGTPFNVPLPLRLEGELSLPALSSAIDGVVRRHEVLRTRFLSSDDGQPFQAISDAASVPLPLVDLGELPEGARQADLVKRLGAEAVRPFDLAAGPLLRAVVFRLAERDHVVLFTAHHAVFDGWSANILAREIALGYAAARTGRPASLTPLPVQYADYAVWQRRVVQGEFLESHVRYWKETLAGSPSTLSLPTDRPPATDRLFHGDCVTFTLPRSLSDSLRATSRGEGVTLFMVLLAAFQSLLARLGGQEDVVVGTPVANRSQAELQGLIGFCVNVLPLRTDLSGNPSFRDVLARVRETCLGAFSHQDVPFGVLVERLAPDRHAGHSPIFQAQFALQAARAGALELPDLRVGSLAEAGDFAEALRTLLVETTPASDLLFLQMVDSGADLSGVLLYRADLFERETVRRLVDHFQRLLATVAAEPGAKLADVDLMPPEERRQVLVAWNQTDEAPAPHACVHELFEARARETPEAVAVALPARERSDGRKPGLTYEELDRRANQLAHRLIALGIEPEHRVGMCLDRSLEMTVAVLGILKSGAAYVPLDPAYPRERLTFLSRSAVLSALVTREALQAALPPRDVPLVCLDTDPALTGQPDDKPAVAIAAESPAYVIYTSGSTGEPKGVVVSHRSVVNHNASVAKVFGLTPRDRVLQFHSISFDAAVEELFPTWWAGATVVLREAGLVAPGHDLHRLVEHERLTVLNLPTAYWHEWTSELERTGDAPPAPLRLVIVGGERASPERYRQWRERAGSHVRWLNTYGPTETTVISTWDEPGAGGEGEMAIGRPLANTRTYVLDERMRPVPVGVVGELYIGGEGVARGYLRRPDLTAERFVPDPFGAAPGARLYRTGDRARHRADGRLECLGRLDEQVKIRGFRIEPAEIESALARCPGVREAAVVAVENAAGKRLVAFVGAQDGHSPTPTGLREYLEARLPAHMVPSAFVGLDRLPLTPSGKADRRALSAVAVPREVFDESYVAPRTATEQALARLWSELLGVDRVGLHDDFFRLGGHSLLAARLVARVGADLAVDLPLRAFVERPTLAATARSIDESSRKPARGAARSGLIVIQHGGNRRPLFLLPAADGTVACYLDLARHLDPELPVYGIVLPEPLDGSPAAPRIETLAAHAVEAIASIQPDGPYQLGGWSWGGIVAYETARQLRERGASVGLLALFDAWALDRSPAHRAARAFEPSSALLGVSLDEWLRWTPEQRSMRLIERLRTAHGPVDRALVRMSDELGLPFDQFAVLLEEVLPEGAELRQIVAEAARAQGLPSDARRREVRDKLKVLAANLSALARYELRPYDGVVTVFPAGMRSAEDLSLGWQELASGGVEVRAVPGHHYTMLREPHVRALGEKLRASLEAPVETT